MFEVFGLHSCTNFPFRKPIGNAFKAFHVEMKKQELLQELRGAKAKMEETSK